MEQASVSVSKDCNSSRLPCKKQADSLAALPSLALFEEAPADEVTLGEPIRKELGDQPKAELTSCSSPLSPGAGKRRKALQQRRAARRMVQQDITQLLQAGAIG